MRGLYVGERRLPDPPADAADWLAARAETMARHTVRFYVRGQIFETTLARAGVSLDVPATLARAALVGHRGEWWDRLRETEDARNGALESPLVWEVDEAQARATLRSFAPALARAPKNARLDLVKHQRVAEEEGSELDVDASLAALEAGSHDDEEAIALHLRAVPAKVAVSDLTHLELEKVVSSFETTFATYGSGAARAVNIRNAVSKFDGTVLAPGAVFSFNETVGPRTHARGFVLAPEIQGDELQNGYGGGTCQSSSTLHAAALFGALEILGRQSHSRPSSYTKLGLDAAVSFPQTDLRIRNSLPFTVMIHAFFPKPNALRVEILGGNPVATVDYTYGVANEEDFIRRITVKENLAPGTKIRHQKGSRGYDVTSYVRVRYHDGHTEERHYSSGYRPAPEVFWVAPGFDTQELPPLPDHAKGVEGQSAAPEAATAPVVDG